MGNATARRLLEVHKIYDYEAFHQINGDHPFKERVPFGYVEYQVRKRKHGKVIYFNFALAKEMGLISQDHPHKLTRELVNALLDTFSIQIINEYDIIHRVKIDKRDIKPNRYMATRYLQLQHPDRIGLTSGDGRSIWNGYFKGGDGRTWDITSCGTGGTCLSPATALNGKFYKTGDKSVSYGCGYSEIDEGICDVVFSEIFHRNNIPTERSLVIIGFPEGYSINVRAGLNLLRPSHFFNHLKQENFLRLKGVVDLFIDRQIANKNWPNIEWDQNRYRFMLRQLAHTFARMAARFEVEYIFCWLDWDGDNILADGGIIDFGSIRQFGLFHYEYRFDDVERWSTNILEQKQKARYIIQTFCQLVDFLNTKRKKPIKIFSEHPILNHFDKVFEDSKRELQLAKMGFVNREIDVLMRKYLPLIKQFEKVYLQFERTKSVKGPEKVTDGITWSAVFCMRDILRELPICFRDDFADIAEDQFIEIIRSNYATRKDLVMSDSRRRKIRLFQLFYRNLIKAVAKETKRTINQVLDGVIQRSGVINRYERVTGDSIVFIGEKITRNRNKLSSEGRQSLIEKFIEEQILVPENRRPSDADLKSLRGTTHKLMTHMLKIVKDYREGI